VELVANLKIESEVFLDLKEFPVASSWLTRLNGETVQTRKYHKRVRLPI
jgi:hypothetical protein